MVVKGFIGQAPNPGNKLRNQVPYSWRTNTKEKRDVPESPMNREQNPFSHMVPKMYRRVEMRYSKLGVDDFNFQHYNKTPFAGLEIHIPNAYCNSMLQAFYFLEPLKVSLQNHLCEKEFCLACELGFLFDMLDKSAGQTCQASNFLRAFRTLPEASALGLLLPDADESLGRVNYPRLIQSWQRFVLQQLNRDTEEQLEKNTNDEKETRATCVIESLFGFKVQRTSECSQCGRESKRDDLTLLAALTYPETAENQNGEATSFVSVLKSSLLGVQTSPAWCDNCNKFQSTIHSKKLLRLPDVLTVNCQVDVEKHKEFWNRKLEKLNEPKSKEVSQSTRQSIPCRFGDNCTRIGCTFWHNKDGEKPPATEGNLDIGTSKEDLELTWVPAALKLKLAEDGSLTCEEWDGEKNYVEDEAFIYDLVCSVAHIQDFNSPGNLVALVKVDSSYQEKEVREEHGKWYLFNDFAVYEVSEDHAVEFDLSWKTPCILQFCRRNMKNDYDRNARRAIDQQIIMGGVSLSHLNNPVSQQRFTPLDLSEVPQEGFLVGIDCEFVTLNQEESEIRSDGTRSTIKPCHMSVARVTCVRGEGQLQGVPFIDDYISTSEQVVDYLTEFSGINPGDLDAALSSKHLTTLKTTYLKLKYLIEQKVVFVGHGLKKDFRVLNILVPKPQVVDTVELFHLPKQRFISLRFLAWYFLGITIQSSTHDSTEDACTALRLYARYRELMKKGEQEFHGTLNRLYETGRSLAWQVED